LENPTPQTLEQRTGQTAEYIVEAPTTPELTPKPRTDQIQPRGTDRQPLAKATAQDVPPPPLPPKLDATIPLGTPPGAITNVSRPYPEELDNLPVEVAEVPPPQAFGAISLAHTLVEEETDVEAVPLELSTAELQRHAAAKPFFTRLLAPGAAGQSDVQHRRLVRAVPLVLLALIVLLVLAYMAAK
jgi:hypothetical protein